METWKKILIPFVVTLVVGGFYLFIVFKHRQEPGVQQQQAQQQRPSADDLAVVRMEFQQHYEDLADLVGKPLWMKNGYSMPYFPYTGGHVDFRKPVGLIPPDQKLDVVKIIKAAAPAAVHDNIEHGDRQAMIVFTLPGDGTGKTQPQFATPVGFLQGNDEHYFCDLLFYYDDPHTIYSNWPKDVWAAIDAHTVKPGMSELQTRTAIGMKAQPDGQTEGERTVDYDVNGKHVVVTYVHNKATQIQTK